MKFDRHKVYSKYNGHCAYCGCEITLKEMQVDHVIPQKRFDYHMAAKKYFVPKFLYHVDNVNHPDNLMPACRQCNFYKGDFNLNSFRNQIATALKQNIEKPFQFRLGIKYGMVEVKEWDTQFYFEKIGNIHDK